MEGIAKTDDRVNSLGVDGAAGVGSRGKGGMRLQNPFTFKVGQVFTGFGVGCGVGIGVGRPINMGAIPIVNQVMSATRGATDAFSGVTRHVNDSLRRVGAKNIEAGIGCGVGFGHGFGVGLALKPGVIHQIQSGLIQAGTKLMMKFGMAPNLILGQSPFPSSFQGGMNMMNQTANMTPLGNVMQLAPQFPGSTPQLLPQLGNMGLGFGESNASKDHPGDAPDVNRTEKVLNDFLQNPILKREDPQLDGLALNKIEKMAYPSPRAIIGCTRSIAPICLLSCLWSIVSGATTNLALPFLGDFRRAESNGWEVKAGRLRSENNLLQMVLKHQQVIEELKEQNQKLQHILVEELKVPPSKIHGDSISRDDDFVCKDCFECRRKQRRR